MNYKITKSPRGYTTTLNGKVQTICIDEESALHSIWVLEGKKQNLFYVADKDGNVACIDRDTL